MCLSRETRAVRKSRVRLMAVTENPCAFAASPKTGITHSAVLHPKTAATAVSDTAEVPARASYFP